MSYLLGEKQIQYLFNITPIDNLELILKNGLMCKNDIIRLNIDRVDLSNQEVQSLRDNVLVDNENELHDYANLYFNPRNAMLYSLICKGKINSLCIICIDPFVLDKDGVVITNQNAAAAGTIFSSVNDCLSFLNFDEIYLKSWDSNDYLEKIRLKKVIMSEALVPKIIEPTYIKMIYVPNEFVKNKLEDISVLYNIEVLINKDLFFE